MKLRISTLDILVAASVVIAGIVGLLLMYWLLGGASIIITNTPGAEPQGPPGVLSGLPCERHDRRPVAVMLASDPEARPLSGIAGADMVFEMPVTPNGITRMMAVYQCNDPEEIGSIRSARQDFIPLAQGVDAILAHWGGEKQALDALDRGVMDNVDALKYEGTTFYRNDDIPRPHNGFTTLTLIGERSLKLGYRATTSLDLYERIPAATGQRNLGSLVDDIRVAWPQGMDVAFTYDSPTNSYLRERGGEPEIDASTGQPVHAAVVILVQTQAHDPNDQYIRVDTVGDGIATVWQNGQRINALWHKERPTDILQFTDSRGVPVPLQAGTVWILIDAPLP